MGRTSSADANEGTLSGGRLNLAGVVLAAVAFGVVIVASQWGRPATGPLKPQENVLGFGFRVPPASTFSCVVLLSAAEPVTVTVDGVSLRNPTPGLDLVGAGIVREHLDGQHYPTYPPADVLPVQGAVVTTHPDESSTQIALGIQVPAQPRLLSASGVWIDYEVNGQHFRSILGWLLNVCTTGAPTACHPPNTSDFSFPPQ